MSDTARQAEITVGELDAILEEVERLQAIALVAQHASSEWETDLFHDGAFQQAMDALRAALAVDPVHHNQGETQ